MMKNVIWFFLYEHDHIFSLLNIVLCGFAHIVSLFVAFKVFVYNLTCYYVNLAWVGFEKCGTTGISR